MNPFVVLKERRPPPTPPDSPPMPTQAECIEFNAINIALTILWHQLSGTEHDPQPPHPQYDIPDTRAKYIALKARLDQLSHLAVPVLCEGVNELIDLYEKEREAAAATPDQNQVEEFTTTDIAGTLLDVQATGEKHNPELEALADRLLEASTGVATVQMALKKDWEAAAAMIRNLDNLVLAICEACGATEELNKKLSKVQELVRSSGLAGK